MTTETASSNSSEFIVLVAPDILPAVSSYTEDQLNRIFNMFDRDGDGYITAAGARHLDGEARARVDRQGADGDDHGGGHGRRRADQLPRFSHALTWAAFDNSWA
ncbi:putative calcium-binding protein CML11 [Iris pallida]|uniref:Calcium-binding protein CML11 n=1 Tax=Iris pallida TaxID=29817 RepID=A0AAX6HZC0_IRIPA|nr:putative calcium-binding protein CML11 [Iris pallida]